MKNSDIHLVWKPVGLTPLEAIGKLRLKKPPLKDEKMTFAGRLDPLAEGVLVILAGEARFKKDQYLSFSKEYEVEILFGVSTDTGDVLGLVKETKFHSDISAEDIKKVAERFIGKHSQTAPPFSSPGLSDKIFTREIELKDIEVSDCTPVFSEEILPEVFRKIALIAGDFRQVEILKTWSEAFSKPEKMTRCTLIVRSSAGAYMRLLAENVGAELGVPALALAITRTKVGKWQKEDCLFL
jgi:tRNA pseudouridine55 synthase